MMYDLVPIVICTPNLMPFGDNFGRVNLENHSKERTGVSCSSVGGP